MSMKGREEGKVRVSEKYISSYDDSLASKNNKHFEPTISTTLHQNYKQQLQRCVSGKRNALNEPMWAQLK